MELHIRTLTPMEVGTLVDWAAEEGWNPGLHDSSSFVAADPEGFLGGVLNNELVTGISAVRYGSGFGFIGLFITRPDFRFRGYGRAVWQRGIERLGGHTIGLDGVPEQQENYQRKGFVRSYGTTRYSGVFTQVHSDRTGIQPVGTSMIRYLHTIDQQHFPADRQAFLWQWIDSAHCAYALIRDDEIRGFGVARACRDGFKIGPLFAADLDTAISLVSALAAGCEGTVHIDVPDYQSEFLDYLVSQGMAPGFSTARMYAGRAPEFSGDGVYAVTSLELG